MYGQFQFLQVQIYPKTSNTYVVKLLALCRYTGLWTSKYAVMLVVNDSGRLWFPNRSTQKQEFLHECKKQA